jgi:hypothetical protein
MTRTASLGAAALSILAGLGVAAGAEERPQSLEQFNEMPAFWAVTGVRSDDVLHLRDVPLRRQ